MSTLERVGRQLPSIESVSYANRTSLRIKNSADGARVFVDTLGSFIFKVGDTTVDDGETCFATSNGRWLLETVSPSVVDSKLSIYTPTDELAAATSTNIVTVTATSTLTLSQAGQIFVDASLGAITLTLPAATNKITYRFTRIDNTSNQVTISRAGTDTLGVENAGQAALDVVGYTLQLTGNGTNRWIRTYSSPINYRWSTPGAYSWRRPLDASVGKLVVVSAGGGGASGGRSGALGADQNGGQGGCGGGAIVATILLPPTASVNVGAGGIGGTSLTSSGGGNSGSSGGNSGFGSYVVVGGPAGTSPPSTPTVTSISGATSPSNPSVGLSYADFSVSAITSIATTTDLAMDDDGSGYVTLIKTVTPTSTNFTHLSSVYPAGCSGGWGANASSNNTPGYDGADHAVLSGIVTGPSGAGGMAKRGSNAIAGQPGDVGSGGGGGGAAHDGNSGAGGVGGNGLVTLSIA